jgi:hypothetical protein
MREPSSEEVLALWKHLAEGAGGEWSEDGFGFFQFLADKPSLVAAAFAPLRHGSEIASRVQSLIAAADDSNCAYFVVRSPSSLACDQARHLAEAHLRSYVDLAAHAHDTELGELLRACAAGVGPQYTGNVDAVSALALERIGDYLGEVAPELAFGLGEAFYSMACDYQLVWHLTWPWYRPSVGLPDPFASYFNLWRHGLAPVFNSVGAPPNPSLQRTPPG